MFELCWCVCVNGCGGGDEGKYCVGVCVCVLCGVDVCVLDKDKFLYFFVKIGYVCCVFG